MAQYGKKEYWEDRYTRDPEPFDWYQRWSALKDHLSPVLRSDHRILVTGCGNSRLSEDMYADGFKHIDNIDISSVVINAMQEKYKNYAEMTWKTMDCRSLESASETYDIIIDKGTSDAILCGEGSTTNIDKSLSEMCRVLVPGGVYIYISYGGPDHRMSFLEKETYGWTVETSTIVKPSIGSVNEQSENGANNVHYIYKCTKKPKEE